MQQYDITVPANSPFRIGAAGRYIKYVAGSNGGGDASLNVTPGMQGGNKITLIPGQAYRIADDAAVPDSWTVANAAGGATILGKIVVGNGRIDDPTIAGVVQVVDGGKARSLAGSAFSAYGLAGAVAGAYDRVQLWNPASNPNRMVVENITMAAGTVGVTAVLQFYGAQIGALTEKGKAKLYGAGDSVGGVYQDTNAAPPAGSTLQWLGAQASSAFIFKPVEPFILPPGSGLVLLSSQVNVQMGGSFEWYEEPNV